ncbi:MAG: right-handed parallel beta-helix repeat-containing protein, partial [Phycisphaerales bacterium JB038]
ALPILQAHSEAILRNCTISFNTAVDGGGVGMRVDSNGRLEGCQILDNSAEMGGGLFADVDSFATVSNSIIRGNSATGQYGLGGGLACYEGSGASLTSCTITRNTADHSGGGFYSTRYGELTFLDCTVSDNWAAKDGGGGLAGWAAYHYIMHCTFSGNVAEEEGGGYYSGGAAYISHSSFISNTAHVGGGLRHPAMLSHCLIAENHATGSGGGLHGGVSIDNCTITRNTADGSGGGVSLYRSQAVFVDCAISNNTSVDTGGGVSCWEYSPKFVNCTIESNVVESKYGHGGAMKFSHASPKLVNCIIRGNRIVGEYGRGGAIYFYESGLPLAVNCTIVDNSADHEGGALFCYNDCHPDLLNCTIAGNNAASGPAAYCDSFEQESPNTMDFHNCIVWNGSEPFFVYDNSRLDLTYNAVEGGADGAGNIDADPRFVDPDGPDDDPWTWADNNYRVLPDSPCIDAGSNAMVGADLLDLDGDGDTAEPVPFDAGGCVRFFDDPEIDDTGSGTPPIVDIGPYESVTACTGDVDGDGDTDQADLGLFLITFERLPSDPLYDPRADFDLDGDTDQSDFSILLADYGCAPSARRSQPRSRATPPPSRRWHRGSLPCTPRLRVPLPADHLPPQRLHQRPQRCRR